MTVTCPLCVGDIIGHVGDRGKQMLLSHLQGAATPASCGQAVFLDLPIFQEKLRNWIFI